MESVPSEIIEYILQSPGLSIKDIVNFSSTSSKFREIISDSSVLWKSKYFQRWPKTSFAIVSNNWMKEFISRKQFEEKIWDVLNDMSDKFYSVSAIADIELDYVGILVDSHEYGYHIAVNYLLTLNNQDTYKELTAKYYSEILLRFIKRRHYSEVWKEFKREHEIKHTLEKAAILVANCFQIKEESVNKTVTQHLNSIAEAVRESIRQDSKDHPLNFATEDQFIKWRNEALANNMFQPYYCKQIISSIHQVLFHQMQYGYRSESSDRETSFGIDFAVSNRKTTPLQLAVIFESVARRLGVKCEIIDVAFITWTEDFSNPQSPYWYVELSGKTAAFIVPGCGARLRPQGLYKRHLHLDMQTVAELATKEIYIAKDMYFLSRRGLLELMLVLRPYDIESYRLLGKLYMYQKMDIRGLITKMEESADYIKDIPSYVPLLASFQVYAMNWEQNQSYRVQVVKRRTEDIDFAVGMIGLHKRYGYMCVVYGWDEICNASPSWIHEMGVENLMKKDRQPFYNVLAQDGSVRYVAQENLLVLHTPPLFCHPEIGRYFEEYCVTHYKANRSLEAEYPEDSAALQKILDKHREPNQNQ